METTATFQGKEVRLKATGAFPHLYRAQFGRDVITDLRPIVEAYKEAGKTVGGDSPWEKEESDRIISSALLDNMDAFERVAWLMMRSGGEEVGRSYIEWLDTIDDAFGFYELLPAVINLWNANKATTAISKKK